MDIHLDHNLIYQAEKSANGKNIHKIKNLISVYRNCYELLIEEFNQHFYDKFKKVELELRKLINSELNWYKKQLSV
jgi:hypothetical protein